MNNLFKDSKILITGGTGSIGNELVKYFLDHEEPSVIRIFDQNESEMFYFQNEISRHKHFKNVRFLIGDVRDKERLKRAFEGIDYVFHTAAYKHVRSSEYNPSEAVKTNVLGVQNVIDACIENNVKKMIFTSSDKAVNPNNTMGATKLLGEKLMTAANYHSGRNTIFACTRFGNVMGSRGSVIPLFKKQIETGNPVTLTNPDMTRFMMSKSQAVKLIVTAMERALGGEVFIFKMPVLKIMDLAECMVEEISDSTANIEIVGNKPGETLFEELLTEHEMQRALELDEMYILLPEMTDLYPIDFEAEYKDAKAPTSTDHRSKNATPISKEEVRKTLIEENLL
ncbi:polysaccharide biosynthesis protein [Methanococcoides sp. SA1]|nr:polysaccharide biosynthesis protein [Methanococcoides sp. SA1]